MTGKAKIALAVVGTGFLYGVGYYSNINKLVYGLAGVNFGKDGRVGIQISVLNNSGWFTYPVPGAFFNIYDAQGQYLGSLESDDVQYIRANSISILQMWVIPTWQGLLALLADGIANPDALSNIFIKGILKVGGQHIYLDTPIQTGLQIPPLKA